MRPHRLVTVALLALLAGCADDPPPQPDPPAREQPGPEPAPPGVTTSDPPPAPGARPKVESPTVKLTSKRFGPEIHRFQVGDLIEVEQPRGGVTRGAIEKISEHELVLRDDGRTGEFTRLRPAHVVSLTLLYRPVLTEQGGDTPTTPQESWLERHAPGQVLGRDPHVLWNVRFLHAVPLIVKRTLTLNGLDFLEREHARSYFKRAGMPHTLYQHDEVKLVGTTLGYHRALQTKAEPCIGTVYLYLVRRDHTIWPVHSLDRLHPADLSAESVKRFLEHEPVTVVLGRPGEIQPLKVYRLPASRVRIYRANLEAIPEPDALRRMRAKRDPKLADAEGRLKKLLEAFGLRTPAQQEKRLEVSLYLPAAAEGGLHLLHYKRVIGLD